MSESGKTEIKRVAFLSSVLVALALMLVFCGEAKAQTTVQPDCAFFFNFTAAGNSGTYTNLPAPSGTGGGVCTFWTMSYAATGYSALSLTFQSAPALAGSQVLPGAWVTYTGTVSAGANPSTTITGAQAFFTNGAVATPFLRVNLAGLTGSGRVWGEVYGYKTGFPGASAGPGSGCVGTIATPCVVVGPGATAAAVVGSPVRIAGSDGTNTRNLITDTTGRAMAVGAAADGVAVAGNPLLMGGFDGTNAQSVSTDTSGQVIPSNASSAGADGVSNTVATQTGAAAAVLYPRPMPVRFNGSTWDREYSCNSQAVITFTAASGSLEIVSLTASQVIRICHVSLSSSAATNITLQYGTGSNCGTGTTAISGAYNNVVTLAINFMPEAAPRTAASNAFCVVSSATATIGGMVVYAKY